MRGLLFTVGVILAFAGGATLLLSEILGTIVVTNLPFFEIGRRDEPERFRFWRSVMAATFLSGILLLGAALAL